MLHFLYSIENKTNGKIYIGFTKNPKKRWAGHRKIAKGGPKKYASHSYIHYAINKYGAENFIFNVYDVANSKLEAEQKEIYWIAEMKKFDITIYNLTDGGGGPSGFKFSEESKTKMSKTQEARHLKNAKFNTQQCIEMQKDYLSGMSQKDIRSKYSASISNVKHIIRGIYPTIKGKSIISDTARKVAHKANLHKRFIIFKTQEDNNKIINLFNSGLNLSKIANIFSCSDNVIKKILNKNGIFDTSKNDNKIHNYKFTKDQIIEVRQKYRSNNYTLENLAKEYQVDAVTIHNIVNFKTWKNVK